MDFMDTITCANQLAHLEVPPTSLTSVWVLAMLALTTKMEYASASALPSMLTLIPGSALRLAPSPAMLISTLIDACRYALLATTVILLISAKITVPHSSRTLLQALAQAYVLMAHGDTIMTV